MMRSVVAHPPELIFPEQDSAMPAPSPRLPTVFALPAAAIVAASLALLVSAAMAAPATLPPDVAAEPFNVVVLRGLDKVTARISTFQAPVGEMVRFGTLEIVARHCEKSPPEEPPEAAAFLEISEVKHGEPAETAFEGWMFASSPALSALEHPVYDVIVVDCETSSTAPRQRSSGDKAE